MQAKNGCLSNHARMDWVKWPILLVLNANDLLANTKTTVLVQKEWVSKTKTEKVSRRLRKAVQWNSVVWSAENCGRMLWYQHFSRKMKKAVQWKSFNQQKAEIGCYGIRNISRRVKEAVQWKEWGQQKGEEGCWFEEERPGECWGGLFRWRIVIRRRLLSGSISS